MPELIQPNWKTPAQVRCAISTRNSFGASIAPFDSANLATHVGDDLATVQANRTSLQTMLGIKPVTWISQVHGIDVLDLDAPLATTTETPVADAVISRQYNSVCAVLTADCLPVLLCDVAGTVVAAAHAGWRGLADGVLEATVQAMRLPNAQILAYIGPGIGPHHFEVGDEVRQQFIAHHAETEKYFKPNANQRWQGDLAAIASYRLQAIGVTQITQSGLCTASDLTRFYSHRNEGGTTGRFASLIWLESTKP